MLGVKVNKLFHRVRVIGVYASINKEKSLTQKDGKMLYTDFINHDGKSIHKVLHYFPIYERHFSKYINQTMTFLEIGVSKGGSLQMWKRYFGPLATIVGIDINPVAKYEDDGINIRIGSQTDHTFLAKVIDEFGAPDVVLDDGSHVMSDIKTSFEFLYPLLPKNGVYMVEDLHTAYWERYEGGLNRKNTFIEYCKEKIDELNAYNIPGGGGQTD